MSKLPLHAILIIIAGIACGIWDVTVACWFPMPFNAIRFTIPMLAILGAFSRSRPHMVAGALAAGLAFDAFAPSNAGWMTIRAVAVVLLIQALTSTYLTNRSIPAAIVIGGLTAVLDRAFLVGFQNLFAMLGRTVIPESGAPVLMFALWTAFTTALVFVAIAAFSRRFLPIFSKLESSARIPLWKS